MTTEAFGTAAGTANHPHWNGAPVPQTVPSFQALLEAKNQRERRNGWNGNLRIAPTYTKSRTAICRKRAKTRLSRPKHLPPIFITPLLQKVRSIRSSKNTMKFQLIPDERLPQTFNVCDASGALIECPDGCYEKSGWNSRYVPSYPERQLKREIEQQFPDHVITGISPKPDTGRFQARPKNHARAHSHPAEAKEVGVSVARLGR